MIIFAALLWLNQPITSNAVPVGAYPAMEGSASAPIHVAVKWYTTPSPEPPGWEAPEGNSANFAISGKDSDTYQNMEGTIPVGNPYTLIDMRILCLRGPEDYTTLPDNPSYRGIDGGKMTWDWGLVGPVASMGGAETSKPKKPIKYINRYVLRNENLPNPIMGVLVRVPSIEKDADVAVEQVIWIDP